MWKLETEADIKMLDSVIDFVNTHLEEMDCPMKMQIHIDIAVEELFVNIAHYAYEGGTGKAEVIVEKDPDENAVLITFIDSGIPYDPLEKPDPDVTLAAEDRQIGGLGIFMVKKSMDDMRYRYENGQNILTIKKILS